MSAGLYDKTGREIHVGDVLKVYHFTGPRRRRYYMYKQAVAIDALGASASPWMRFSHLDMTGDGYHEAMDGRCLDGYEIVQGLGHDWENVRPRRDRQKGARI